MRAVVIPKPGDADVLKMETRPLPRPGVGQVLVKVGAAGVNRADIAQREGRYPAPLGWPADVPGMEIAGEVVAVGEGVDEAMVGSRVVGLVGGGGYAEYCVVPVGATLPWPQGYDAVGAAALPEALFTVWSNVFERGRLQAGETLLVHGGASGIGTAAIALGKAFGARVFVTAGSADRCARCRELGADLAIDYKSEDFVEAVKEATGGRGVDVILDIVGGSYVSRNYRAAAVEGRIVQIAFQGGAEVQVNIAPLMLKRLTHTGSTLRAREDEFKAGLAARLREHVWPRLDRGELAPVIDAVFPLSQAAEAHRYLEGDHVGKVILTP